MNKKLDTVKLTGGAEYAKVAERLKQFREECPNGLIETEPTIRDDGQLLFKAHILKDKAKAESGEATGHALGKNTGAKAFEKLETIAVGRALAMLGYLASGEVASSEEMAEFHEYKNEKIEEAIAQINQAETIEELKNVFINLGNLISEPKVTEAKDKRKAVLSAPKDKGGGEQR